MPHQNSRFSIEGNTRGADDEALRTLPKLLGALGPTTGARAIVIQVSLQVSLSAFVWFLAVMWLNFAAGAEVDLALAVVTGFFVVLLTLLLAITSMAMNDPRWRRPPQAVPASLRSAPERLRKYARRPAARPGCPLGVVRYG